MKKILALILCLAMVFSLTAVLAGCGDEEEDTKDKTSDVDKDTEKEDADKDEEEEVKDASIYNTWEGDMDYAPVLKAMFAEVGDDDLANILTPKSFKIAMTLEFDEEGTVKLEVDKKSMEKAMEKYVTDLSKDLVDYMVDMYEEQGISKEELLESAGVSTDDELAEYILENADLNIEDMISVEDMSSSDEYEIDGNVISLGDGIEMTFKIKGEKMTVTWGGVPEQMEGVLPTTFTVK